MEKLFDTELVKKQFNTAAHTYDSVAIIQRNAADQLLERIAMIKLNPNTILDLGAGTGYCAKKLAQQFPDAQIIALDVAENLLSKIENEKIECIVAQAEKIPLPDNSVDLIVSNMMLHWSVDLPAIFKEAKRVLTTGGLFLYTTLGPETLHELRTSWNSVDEYNHVHHFYDMHDLGDAMLHAGFQDPVMDMQMLTLRYRDLKDLFADFKSLGVRNVAEPRKQGLTTQNQMKKMLSAYEQFKIENTYPATYELLFGHACGKPEQVKGEYRVSVDSIIKKNVV